MKTLNRLKSNTHLRRRSIVIDEINILRNFEGSQLIQNKIEREMSKLHLLWFKDSGRSMSNFEI
jgi:hypothetical protein